MQVQVSKDDSNQALSSFNFSRDTTKSFEREKMFYNGLDVEGDKS